MFMLKARVKTGKLCSGGGLPTPRPSRPSRFALTACLLLVAALVLFAFSGCKYSDVLTQHLEDPELGTTFADSSSAPLIFPAHLPVINRTFLDC